MSDIQSESESRAKILLIEDNAIDAELVQRFLHAKARGEYAVSHALSLEDGLNLSQLQRFAVILLDLNLPDSLGQETFDQTYQQEKLRTPIVVMTGNGDEDEGAHLVRNGAYDFLEKGNFDGVMLAKVLRFARERFALVQELVSMREKELLARERESREHELRVLAEMAQTNHSSAQLPRSLHEAVPSYFAKLVGTYGQLLEMALERRIYRDKSAGYAERLRTLAQELGQQRASPKDLVRLHSRALQKRTENESQALKQQAYIEEGRLLLLELMGYIIEFYRAPAGASS